jgi:RNA polymerase-binding transcription factor DksA
VSSGVGPVKMSHDEYTDKITDSIMRDLEEQNKNTFKVKLDKINQAARKIHHKIHIALLGKEGKDKTIPSAQLEMIKEDLMDIRLIKEDLMDILTDSIMRDLEEQNKNTFKVKLDKIDQAARKIHIALLGKEGKDKTIPSAQLEMIKEDLMDIRQQIIVWSLQLENEAQGY